MKIEFYIIEIVIGCVIYLLSNLIITFLHYKVIFEISFKKAISAVLKYTSYISRHKWYVFLECLKVGKPFSGIIHDWSKFSTKEFFPYAFFFYGEKRQIRDKSGYYRPYVSNIHAFTEAWHHHMRLNKHHWQYWVIPADGDDVEQKQAIPVKIPLKYIEEMICDWKGAGRAQHSTLTVKQWYELNKDKMIFDDITRQILEIKIENS